MDNSLEYHRELIRSIIEGEVQNKDDLQRYKIELCRELGLAGVPPNSETLAYVDEEQLPLVEAILQRKPVRTLSGVAVVAVMTSPAPCPHGKCIYCPGGVDSGSPQSYTGKEPAARRGASYEFDPFRQVTGRIAQLESIGHHTDKIDLIIMGGTFTSRPRDYQTEFVKRCFDAMNSSVGMDVTEAQSINETSEHRCVGLTVETRPDAMTEEQVSFSMGLGMTRVEMGVQILDDMILRSVDRGHGLGEVERATKVAKQNGLKICYHIMPGLPGSNPEKDIASFKMMFDDPRYRPDMLKLYPTLVVKGTKLYDMWTRGEYAPYTTEQAVKVMAEMKTLVPEYVRIQRIQRDIPVPLIEAGVDKGHLRELIKERMRNNGQACRCIRCREVGLKGIVDQGEEDIGSKRITYEASGGTEHFITREIKKLDSIVGYARLRTDDGPIAGLRELKVFGRMVSFTHPQKGWQHRGLGKELVIEAEEIAREQGCRTIRVTSGVGVRRYYSSMGYEKLGPYMTKTL